MSDYIWALDQGTTGTTAALIDTKNFKFVDKVNREFPQIYPTPGHVEHNLNDIWQTVEATTKELLAKNNVSSDQIKSIGITNQRETTCAFKKNGDPLHNAIVWQDRRTTDFCNSLKNSSLGEKISQKTGLTIDPYFSASKMNWLLKKSENVKRAYKSDDLLFGTIDTFLLYKLSGGEAFRTEASNASRTLLMSLETTDWDDELLNVFEISKKCLPEICDSFYEFGQTKGLSFLSDGIKISGILGDQQSALFGQAGFREGNLKCTYGTGAFFLLNTGTNIKYSKNGLLTTVAYKANGKTYYALEGSCFIAGAAVQWIRDNLKIIPASPDVENLARGVKDNSEMEHILFLPFFTGLGSPYWKPEAKAAIIGLTRDTGTHHLARACLEGIALSINDLLTACKEDTSLSLKSLKVDGGACANNYLMEIQATISDIEIIRPKVIETTAYGAAMASAIGADILNIDDIEKLWEKDRSFVSTTTNTQFYNNKKVAWKKTIEKLYS